MENDWFEVDITPLVQEWIDGISTNYGVVLTSNKDKDIKFTSIDGATSTFHPQLVLTLP